MSAARTKKKRQRTHRYTSNVFSMFNQDQIQEFKEAFNMIDQNRDGFIDKDDLIEMLTSLGKNPTDMYLDNMILEAPGPINFTMFLTLFGEKLNGTDPEEVIRNAFGCFDLKNLGNIPEDKLRDIMTTMGDRWTDEKVDELFHGAPIQEGLFDYVEFTRTLKHGAREKDDEVEPPPTPTSAPIPQPRQQQASQKSQAVPKTNAPPPLKTALKKPQPKGPKPQMAAPPLPKSPPPKAAANTPPLPKTPPPKAPTNTPFGTALKNTGKFPQYKKF